MKTLKAISLTLALLFLCTGPAYAQDISILGSIPTGKEIDSLALAPNTGIAYGINSEGKTLYIFDLKNHSIKKKIRLERKPASIAVHPITNIAYITARDDKHKGILYIADSEGIISTQEITKGPQGIAINPDNNTVVIAIEKDKKLLVLSTETSTVINTINLPLRSKIIALDTDSNRAVIATGKAKKKAAKEEERDKEDREDKDKEKGEERDKEKENEREDARKQNKILIVDLSTGNVLNEITLKDKIKDMAVDTGKDIAIVVSEEEINLIDINTGKIITPSIPPLEKGDEGGFEAVDINQSTHAAVITGDKGILLLDLNTLHATPYTLNAESNAVAVDKYKNTALLGIFPLSKGGQGVVEIQLLNPIPKITNLIPKSSRAGEPGFNLKVEGEKFITTSSVQFNRNNLLTSFKDNKELEALVSPDLITMPGEVPVTVTNPLPDGGMSEPYLFTIKYPTPMLQSISPDTIAARSPDFTLKAYGLNFMQGYIVNFNGQNLQTTCINSSELNATVPSSLIQTKGIYLVVVITPDGQNSNFLNFTVTDPYPVITDFTPKSGQAGTVVTITGDNFNYTPTKVCFRTPLYQEGSGVCSSASPGGVQATIQSLTQTEIKAIVPIGATTGPITVTTSIGSTQSAEQFTALLRQDFALNIKPQSVSMPVNGDASAVIGVQSAGLEQFTGLVRLSVTNAPSGVTATFNPEYISLNQSSILTLKLTSTLTSALTLNVLGAATIEGTDITRTASLTLNPIPSGATTITGRVVASKDTKPVKGVTLTIGSKTTVTDEAGNFFFIDAPVGEQILEIDGDTANTATTAYPSDIFVPVTIIGGVDNKLPYFIYLHEVNTKNFAVINPAADTILTDPEIPDFELKIPAGVQIIGHDGLPNEKISVTLVPVDRLPIRPFPEGVYGSDIYMYYFFKPGGGTPDQPIPVKMPNTFQASPGERITLWYYDESPTPDPNSNQWKPFGMGTVSDDGRNIIPDPGVGIPKFCCGGSRPVPPPKPGGTAPGPQGGGGCPVGGKSIDPYNGMFIHTDNDISFPAPSMLNIERHYKSDNTAIGTFGRGTTTNYDHYLEGTGNALTYITPETGRYILSKNPDGSYTNIQYPFLKGARAYITGSAKTLKFKDGTTYTFDANGRLVEEKDSNGNFVYIKRDALGYITGMTDSLGRVLYITNTSRTIASNVYTLIESVSDESGRTVKYAYDYYGKLISVTNPAGGKTTYTYDTSSRLTSVTNPGGIVELSLTYDTQGRVFKQINADSGEYLFYYFSPSTPVRVVDPPNPSATNCTPQFVREGEQAGSTSGGQANTCGIIYVNVPTSTSVPQGSTATTTITQTVAIYPNKSSKTHRFNSQGYLLSMTDGIGGQTNNDRQISTNALLSVTDKLGRKTAYEYDANGNTSSTTDQAGNTTNYEYDPVFNKPRKITDALGNITTMAYDDKGNLISTTDPLGNTTSITYNNHGQPLTVTDALNNTTTFEYDSKGNLIKTTDPLGNSATMTYDSIGRLLKTTDPKGKSTSYAYDPMSRITEITDAINGKTKFAYDANGNLLTVTDAKGQVISYTYTVRDKVETMTDQLGKIETYSYDKMDNLISLVDRKGQTTTYTYDIENKITKTTYADGSYTDYSYDAADRLTYINDSASGPIEYVYDDAGCSAGCKGGATGKIMQEITTLGSINYEYDAIGRRTSMTVAGQQPVTYQYDANSRLTSVVGAGLAPAQISYDAIGRRTALTLPNGVATNYFYDNASHLLNLQHVNNALNQTLESLTYTYDAIGNRISMNRPSVSLPLPNAASNTSYNNANQMLSFNDKNIIYDANGNMTSVTNSCGTTTYTWDVRNRLAGINGFNSDCSSLTASFKYDALGRRTEKTVNGDTTKYLYDGLDVVQEIKNSTVYANYIRTLNIDEPLVRIKSDGTIRFYQQDALGSIIALTDETGAIKTQYIYDPFGNMTITGESSDNPFQYTGRENDGTGLYYYRARYYSPELQRFISEDPIGLDGGINFFAYVGNNAVNRIDPIGLGEFYCGWGPDGHLDCGYAPDPVRPLPNLSNLKPTNTGNVIAGIALQFGGYILMGTGVAIAIVESPLALVDPGIGGMVVIGGYAWWQGTTLIYQGYSELPCKGK